MQLQKSKNIVYNSPNRTLNSLGLPGAIEALETPHGIPISLLQKMEHVRKEVQTGSFALTCLGWIHLLK